MSGEITMAMVKELRDKTGVGISKCKEALEQAQGDMELAITNLRKAGMVSSMKREGRETKEGMIAISESKEVIALVEVSAETDFVVKSEPFQLFAAHLAKEAASKQINTIEELLMLPYEKDPSLTLDQHRALVMQTVGENIQVKRLYLHGGGESSRAAAYSHMGGKLVALVDIAGSKAPQAQSLAYDLAMHVAAEAPEYLSPQDVPQSIIAREEDIAREQVKDKPEAVVQKIIEGKVKGFYMQVCLTEQKYIRDPSLSIADVLSKASKELGAPLKVATFVRWQVGA